MTKGRDTRKKESKKKPAKTLKEKRAEKASKKDGTFKIASDIKNIQNHRP